MTSSASLTEQQITAFRKKIYAYYRVNRRSFPWREVRSPYHIVVSEIMLQQTQAPRVVTKYLYFLQAFPDFATLAHAPHGKLLRTWQGLGYNRRALYLQKLSQAVISQYGGQLPHGEQILRTLPGIGPATAASICAFAFNQPTIFIETNIRAVFIHEFFARRRKVSDKELLPLVKKTLDQKRPREWYYALMDYGVFLKRTVQNPSRRSAQHSKQTKFAGSNRQLRGLVLRTVLSKPTSASALTTALRKTTVFSRPQISNAVEKLTTEGFLLRRGKKLTVRS